MEILDFGTIIQGTGLPEDIWPALMAALGGVDPGRAAKMRADMGERGAADWPDGDDIWEALDALNEYAPEYAYVGSHEGDGSDIGVWPCWDAIREAVDDGALGTGEDTPEWPADTPFLQVNERGNTTLYGADGREIWALV